MTINRMLVPVGLDDRDQKVLAYACGLGVQGVKELLVATVVDGSGMEPPVLMHAVARARDRLHQMVDAVACPDLDVEIRVVTGEVFNAICGLAHQVDVDVICCGTEGKSFVDYLFSGSVSEDLAILGDERTMTVRYELLEATDDPGRIARQFGKRLVVPTDFSASGMRAVLSAFSRPAAAIDAVHLLHVMPVLEDPVAAQRARADADAQLRGLLQIAEEAGINAITVIRDGDPVDIIPAYLQEIAATGVILGRRGRGRIGREILGSVAMKLLRDATCPVVIQP